MATPPVAVLEWVWETFFIIILSRFIHLNEAFEFQNRLKNILTFKNDRKICVVPSSFQCSYFHAWRVYLSLSYCHFLIWSGAEGCVLWNSFWIVRYYQHSLPDCGTINHSTFGKEISHNSLWNWGKKKKKSPWPLFLSPAFAPFCIAEGLEWTT